MILTVPCLVGICLQTSPMMKNTKKMLMSCTEVQGITSGPNLEYATFGIDAVIRFIKISKWHTTAARSQPTPNSLLYRWSVCQNI